MGRIKKIICVVLLLSALLPAWAAGKKDRSFPRMTFGIEGSFSGTFLAYRHSNFISNYGYRIDRKTFRHRFHGNGEFLLHIGYNVSSNINLSIYSGYSGAGNGKSGHIYPFNLRCTWYPSERAEDDRWFAFLDVGPALKKTGSKADIAGNGRIGGGYRLSITRSVKLDFLISLRQVILRNINLQPGGMGTEYIEKEKIRRNNASYTALTLGVGITF